MKKKRVKATEDDLRVLFIYPEIPNGFWSFSHALPFVGKKAAFPPLGLPTVASMLPQKWDKRLIDLNIERLRDRDIQWADMVFLSGMGIQYESAKKIISRCKSLGVKVVAGGPLFTVEPDKFEEVDCLILGEAELTMPQFLYDLKNGRLQKIYKASAFCDLSKTPIPSWDLVKMGRYASMVIQAGRGCPFRCEFCNVTTLFGHTPRMKSTEKIIAELDSIYDTGWRGSIFFVDDNFIGNRKFLKEKLLPAIIRWRKDKKGCVFFTQTSIDLADDKELLQMMAQAGFDSVFIGIESPDNDSLEECYKKQNKNRDIPRCIQIIQSFGLQVMGGFIVGFDHDKETIFRDQVSFIQETGIVSAMVGMLQAPPGTQLFDRLRQDNRIINTFSGNNVAGSTNIIPKMGLENLVAGYQSLMKQIYSPGNFYLRIRTFLREFKTPDITTPLDFQRFLAFFRAGFRLGIWGKERFHYWYLLFWTMTHKPRLVPLAVTLAIYGHHYRMICEQYIL